MSQPATTSSKVEEDTSKMAPKPSLGTAIDTETAGEIPLHTQQLNTYDPILQQQFIVTQQGSWSTNMVAGYSLFRLPVHPSSCNQYVRYLSGMYGVWGGSVEFQVVIAGTGFNGGKMLMVKTPPYIDSTKMTLADLMIFPNKIIDVKAQESFGVEAQDQRPLNYHQVNIPATHVTLTIDTSFVQMTSTGGWVNLVVLNPLISANMSVGSVTWTLMTRLGPDFQFNQMVPPHINTEVTTTHPQLYGDDMPSVDFAFDNFYNTLILSTKTTDNHTTRQNLVGVDGVMDYKSIVWDDIEGKEVKQVKTVHYEIDIKDLSLFKLVNYRTDRRFYIKTTKADFGELETIVITPEKITFEASKSTNDPGKVLIFWPKRENLPTGNIIGDSAYGKFPIFSTVRDECFVYYNDSAGADGFGMFQDDALRNFLCRVKPGKNMDLVYVVKQRSNNVALAYLRLNPQGFWSCAKRTTMQKFSIPNIYLQYFSEIEPNASLPREPEGMGMALNLYSLRQDVENMKNPWSNEKLRITQPDLSLSSNTFSDEE